MNRNIARYQRTLKQNLTCAAPTRRALLRKFQSSLDAFLEETPSPTEAALTAAFGTPQEMAAVLMEDVSQKEAAKWSNCRKYGKIIAAVLYAVFFIYLLYLSQQPVPIIEPQTVSPTIQEEHNSR